jgi:hypothetical protein
MGKNSNTKYPRKAPMSETYNPTSRNLQAQPQEPWHLDKKVPVALIVAIIMQTATAVWWAAGISARDNEQERRISSIEVWQDGTQQQLQKLNESVARMDERLGLQIELLKEIKTNIGGNRR